MNRYHPSLQKNGIIIETWRRLADIRAFTFTARPGAGSTTGWAGQGRGEVSVRADSDGLRFFERGFFAKESANAPVTFRNVYHWRLAGGCLSLGHERFGQHAPVALVDMAAGVDHALVSQAPHHCGADAYRNRLVLTETGFSLYWSITGPNKNETLAYDYSP